MVRGKKMVKKSAKTENQQLSDSEVLAQNIALIAKKSADLVKKFVENQPSGNSDILISNAINASQAFAQMGEKLMEDPTKFWQAQLDFYQEYVELLEETSKRILGDSQIETSKKRDKRFKDEAWQENVVFDFLRQSYLLSADTLKNLTASVDLDEKNAKKIDFYTRQFVDAIAPNNFLLTNPEVLRKTIASNGENLVKGLENLLSDLEESKGAFHIKNTDTSAFTLGKNIATSKGEVVFENDLMQLIQYAPKTKEVLKTPLLIISPWINKYYILDLSPESSFVNWLVEQGHTVFITSWINPTKKLSNKSFEDYMLEGPIAALDAIEKATGEKSTNVIGYCIGGTLLACTLAYLKAKKKSDKVKSATFLTTLVDFSNSGDLGIFIDDEQLDKIEKHMKDLGYLDGTEMSAVFSILRANDMIWSYVINNYMMGKSPLPFDLLYWNSDSTRLPAAMHSFYLRNMYKDNNLVKKGGITLDGVGIDIKTVDSPSYILSTIEDHIAPWKTTYKTTQLFSGKTRFVLSGSGHVAGVINPPVKKKYSYWTNDKTPESAEQWLKESKEHLYSWWEDWHKWILKNQFDGGKISARMPGDGKLKPIEPAPGSYVKAR
jgi:polyhydroxyalkanoate synthase